jgi:hypothetical protein
MPRARLPPSLPWWALHLRARSSSPNERSALVSVSLQDAQDRGFPHVYAGGGWLVGPDSKVFALSSNYSLHDWTVATELLERLYREGLASRLEPALFVDRLTRLTRERQELVDDVVREAAAGGLRRMGPRTLP